MFAPVSPRRPHDDGGGPQSPEALIARSHEMLRLLDVITSTSASTASSSSPPHPASLLFQQQSHQLGGGGASSLRGEQLLQLEERHQRDEQLRQQRGLPPLWHNASNANDDAQSLVSTTTSFSFPSQQHQLQQHQQQLQALSRLAMPTTCDACTLVGSGDIPGTIALHSSAAQTEPPAVTSRGMTTEQTAQRAVQSQTEAAAVASCAVQVDLDRAAAAAREEAERRRREQLVSSACQTEAGLSRGNRTVALDTAEFAEQDSRGVAMTALRVLQVAEELEQKVVPRLTAHVGRQVDMVTRRLQLAQRAVEQCKRRHAAERGELAELRRLLHARDAEEAAAAQEMLRATQLAALLDAQEREMGHIVELEDTAFQAAAQGFRAVAALLAASGRERDELRHQVAQLKREKMALMLDAAEESAERERERSSGNVTAVTHDAAPDCDSTRSVSPSPTQAAGAAPAVESSETTTTRHPSTAVGAHLSAQQQFSVASSAASFLQQHAPSTLAMARLRPLPRMGDVLVPPQPSTRRSSTAEPPSAWARNTAPSALGESSRRNLGHAPAVSLLPKDVAGDLLRECDRLLSMDSALRRENWPPPGRFV